MKIQVISERVLALCIAIIVVCFGAFLTIGYDNPVGDYNEPQLTELIMWLMYLLVVVTAGLTVWSVIKSARSNKGNDSAAATGVPGGKITMFTILLLIVSLAVGLVTGLDEVPFTAADGTVTTAGWVTVVDMFIGSIYILTIAAVLAVAISMSGILTKSASK